MESLITLWSFGVKMNYSDIFVVIYIKTTKLQIAKCVDVF